MQEEHGCSNTWILTVSSGPPPSYSAHTGLEAEKNRKTKYHFIPLILIQLEPALLLWCSDIPNQLV